MIENRDFIVFSDDWGRHPSSCQHIFKRIAQRNRVLWVNTIGMRLPRLTWQDLGRAVEKFISWSKPQNKDNAGIIVYSPMMTPFSNIRFFHWLNNRLLAGGIKKQFKRHNFQDIILVTTVPNVSDLVGRLGEKQDIYYCVDDFSKWQGMLNETIAKMEQELLKKVDLILTTSEELYRSKKSSQCQTQLLTHGVDTEHFRKASLKETKIPEDINKIKGKRIGYFGLFDERIDFEILKYMSAMRPEWAITILGNTAVDTSEIKKYKNLHFLGQVSYALLPDYAKGFDVCVLPYVVGNSTITINPLKFKEYLATGKPIVTTRLPEVEKYADVVKISDTKEEFVSCVDACLKDGDAEIAVKRQDAVAKEGWEFKAEEFSRYISEIPEKKINVMHLRIVTGSGGGPEKTILLSAQQTDKEKFNVISVYLKNKDDDDSVIRNRATQMGIVLHEVLEQGRFDWQAIKEIKKLIEKYDIDILDCHDYKSGIIGLIISKFHPLKLITTIHGWAGTSLKEKLYYWLEKQAIKSFDKVVSVYQGMNKYLLRIGVSQTKLVTIYNAIDVDDFKRTKDCFVAIAPRNDTGCDSGCQNIRVELQLKKTDILIGNVCRLSKEKNLKAFLEVAKKIASPSARNDTGGTACNDTSRIIFNVKFIIAGDGPEKENLKVYAKKLGIEDKVMFLGARKDIKNIYNGLDLFILTSFKEGLPNVVLEALAMEVPVVATKVDGVPELIENGVNGLLFDPKDAESIAGGAIRILDDKQLADNFRREGRKTVCEKFSFTVRTKKMEELYLEVMGG